jgi:hypothetical protein
MAFITVSEAVTLKINMYIYKYKAKNEKQKKITLFPTEKS